MLFERNILLKFAYNCGLFNNPCQKVKKSYMLSLNYVSILFILPPSYRPWFSDLSNDIYFFIEHPIAI